MQREGLYGTPSDPQVVLLLGHPERMNTCSTSTCTKHGKHVRGFVYCYEYADVTWGIPFGGYLERVESFEQC